MGLHFGSSAWRYVALAGTRRPVKSMKNGGPACYRRARVTGLTKRSSGCADNIPQKFHQRQESVAMGSATLYQLPFLGPRE